MIDEERARLIEIKARDLVVNADSMGIRIANRPGMRLVHEIYIEAVREALNIVPTQEATIEG